MFTNRDVNGSGNDTLTNAMWNSTENDVVYNKVSYDAVRIVVRRPVLNDNIKIGSKYGIY